MLAVMEAAFEAMPASAKRVFARKLAAIAEDWERPNSADELKYTARRFLRPALRLLKPPAAA